MLKIQDLSFAYHQKDLLKNIHLELKNQAFNRNFRAKWLR